MFLDLQCDVCVMEMTVVDINFRRRQGKPFQPDTQAWVIENEYKIWLFEKRNEYELQLNMG